MVSLRKEGEPVRLPRIKPVNGGFLHVYNRIAGFPGDFPFGPAEKERFIRLLRRLDDYYTVDVLSFQVMSNHFHLVLHTPDAPPSPEETCRRYAAYYHGEKKLHPESRRCQEIAERLTDVSWFMRDLQQQFSRWFNKQHGRRGALWAGRFKSTVLEDGLAVWDCMKYIAMNPVRAHIVTDPADYRFCSWGAWSALGRHPYQDNLERNVMDRFSGLLGVENMKELQSEFRKELVRLKMERAEDQALEQAVKKAGDRAPFTQRIDRRVRYWVDGLVIGSELFVRETMTKARGKAHMRKRRVTYSSDSRHLCAYRQLRVQLQ